MFTGVLLSKYNDSDLFVMFRIMGCSTFTITQMGITIKVKIYYLVTLKYSIYRYQI